MAHRTRGGRRIGLNVEGLESRRLLAATFTGATVPDGYLPGSIVGGPDGNLWFTATKFGGSAIGKIVPATGATTLYPTPTVSNHLGSIISGPGGDLWFMDNNTNTGVLSLGKVDPATGAIAEVPVAAATASTGGVPGVAEGPDGNLWFTDPANGSVDEFNVASGVTTKFPLPTANSRPGGIVAGPDGNLWFIETNVANSPGPGFHGSVTSIAPTGGHTITQHPLSHDVLAQIIVGPNGNLWFPEDDVFGGMGHLVIGQFDPTTQALSETIINSGYSPAMGLTDGPDGQVWFIAQEAVDQVNPSTLAVSTSLLPDAPGGSYDPLFGQGIVTGPDGNIWTTAIDQTVTVGTIEKATIVPATQAAIVGYVGLSYNGLASGPAPTLGGVTVYVDANADGVFDAGDPSAITGSNGYYQILGVAPGTYTVRVAFPANLTTYPAGGAQTVTATGGQIVGPGFGPGFGVVPGSALLPLSFNANPFGTGNPDVTTAEVVGLYKIYLDRAPDPEGQANAVAYLKGGGSLRGLGLILGGSAEYDARVVAGDYENFLGRAGTSDEVAYWVGLMQGGDSSEQVASLMLASDGFNAQHASDASYVQALYNDLLGRQASDAEVAAWVSVLGGSSRAALAHAFVFGAPAMAQGVQQMAAAFWAQPPDQATLDYCVSFLVTGQLTLADVAASFATSSTFIGRADTTVG